MQYGISLQSIIPVRTEPSHRSEMCTQVLFGELFRISEERDGWLRVELAYDGYAGWIDLKQASIVDEEEFNRLMAAETEITLDLVQMVANETKKMVFPLVIGSSIPGIEGQFFTINGDNFYYEGQIAVNFDTDDETGEIDKTDARQSLVDEALVYLNAPYLWGGRSPLGIDCSGFTQMAFKLKQITLPRDAAQQAGQGETVSSLEDAEPGDLAFFENEEGRITHTGLLIDRNRIIHASGKVRIDAIDSIGIPGDHEGGYTHRLKLIKRYI